MEVYPTKISSSMVQYVVVQGFYLSPGGTSPRKQASEEVESQTGTLKDPEIIIQIVKPR